MSQPGIHHVTAISGHASRNHDFYTRILGLRLVKKTVNFDDPGTYHLYYGDETGTPGTILTFFPWEHAAAGRVGIGQTQEILLRIPASSLGYWTHRLLEKAVPHETPRRRFGDGLLSFRDPDGMALALVAVPGAEGEPGWAGAEVPAEHAVRGLHSVTLLVADGGPTGEVLTEGLGFSAIASDGAVTRYTTGRDGAGGIVDIHAAGGFLAGRQGAGSIHHVAFRAADDAAQAAMVEKLRDDLGLHPTEQKDRKYFRSVYFREPGGILFEIATDGPGFTADEPVAELGGALQLPGFLEERRQAIEERLLPLETYRPPFS